MALDLPGLMVPGCWGWMMDVAGRMSGSRVLGLCWGVWALFH